MKTILFVLSISILPMFCSAQTATDVITKVLQKQASLTSLSYAVQVVDTFTSGDVWNHTGRAQILKKQQDTSLGFYFWGKRDDLNRYSLYNGRVAYDVNIDQKNYDVISKPDDIFHILGSPGGQVIFKDLITLDTSSARNFELNQTPSQFIVTMHYADNIKYDVTNRFKTVWISKTTLLPEAEKNHLVVLGKVQDKFYKVSDLKLSEPTAALLYTDDSFLTSYAQNVRSAKGKLSEMIGKDLPSFELKSFSNNTVSSKSFAGKAVLLDFWAVWCGPCVASMPKVQGFLDKYKSKGLDVYGIMTEEKNLEPAKLFVKKHSIAIPMLVATEAVNKSFNLNAVPLYVLVNKSGKVAFVSEGFSDQLEAEIEKALR